MRLFRWNRNPDDEPELSLPWVGLPSIATFLSDWDKQAPLPDEPPKDDNEVRFAPGALDGIMSHHSSGGDGGTREHKVARLLDLVESAATKSDDQNRAALYRAVQEDEALQLADDLSEAIAGQKRFGPHQLHPLALWLHANAAHRGPFKIALVLMGLCGQEADTRYLIEAARHPEFTLYALVAASNISSDPTDVWWQMAREADGWGKIHLVERLAQLAFDNVALQGWLLRDGCANSIMDEYLAWTCAHYGDLRGALERGEHDEELLEGAGRILVALTIGGPAQDMGDYEDGPATTKLYLETLETRCDTAKTLYSVVSIDRFLERIQIPSPQDETDWKGLGWTLDVIGELRALCAAIMEQPEWETRLRHELKSDDYWQAWECAKALNLDLWEKLFLRLEENPTEAHLYSCLLNGQSTERQLRIAEFARTHLPLSEITSNPQQSLFTSDPASFSLDILIWAMKGEDGIVFFDEVLVDAALRSPSLRTRNGAIAVLEMQPRSEWGPVLTATVKERLRDEPDEGIRQRLKKI